jgi:8-oxo-dGTP pyrophosphatase MutT (NUDIX family)
MPVRYQAAGVVVVRREGEGWYYLVLRAYRNWGFPKGLLESGETHFEAAIRETREETSIDDLAFNWGHTFRETPPYGNGKVARYYLAETKHSNLVLPVSPSLGKPEHDEYRWVSFKQAQEMLPPRVIPILEWVGSQLAETETRGEHASKF